MFFVTLHVSVWVEMTLTAWQCLTVMSRSTWACELKWKYWYFVYSNNKSRSTWACELKSITYDDDSKNFLSRSTWACELKCLTNCICVIWCSHAPRERVSWNSFKNVFHLLEISHAPRERVSWNRTQMCGRKASASRSTWACELKLWWLRTPNTGNGHAPRERVSWNLSRCVLR